MVRRVSAWLISLALLAACAPTTPAKPATEEASTSTEPIASIPYEGNPPTPGSKGPGAFVLQWGGWASLHAIDAYTGEDLPGFKPVQLKNVSSYRVTPEGSLLAMAVFPSNSTPNGGVVEFVNLGTWTMLDSSVPLEGWVGEMAFSPDGLRLAVVQTSPMTDGVTRYGQSMLTLVDVSSRTISAVTTIDYILRQVAFSNDDSELLIYGWVSTTQSMENPEPAYAASLSADDLTVVWETTLDGVLDGIYEGTTAGSDQTLAYSPGVAFDATQSRLYILHANEDALTIVDFGAQGTQTLEIRPALSWLEKLLSLGAEAAHAKGLPGTTKTMVLSPDGRRLYAVGLTLSLTEQGPEWQLPGERMGLQVIDPATGEELARKDTEATEIRFSPDGSMLLLTGWVTETGFSVTEVWNAATLERIYQADNLYLVSGGLMDGSSAILTATSGPPMFLRVLDPLTFEAAASWRADYFTEWIPLP